MRRLLALCILLPSLILGAAGAFSGCSPNTPGLDPRALARGTVETLETVWLVSAKACVEVANDQQSQTTADDCANYLKPARAVLLEAADAVDIWDDTAQKNFPCLIVSALSGINDARGILAIAKIKEPQVVADGLALAAQYVPTCNKDAGK